MNIVNFVHLIPLFVYPVISTNLPVRSLSCASKTFPLLPNVEKKVVEFFEKDNAATREGMVECFNEAIKLKEDKIVNAILEMIKNNQVLGNQLAQHTNGKGIVNFKYGDNFPLHRAVSTQTETIVTLLLDNGADIDAENTDHLTPLMVAIEKRDERLVGLLLQKNPKVDHENVNTRTALMMATEQNDEEFVELLLKSHANMDYKNKKGQTALMLAIEKGNEPMVDLLLRNRANVNLKDNKNQTVLHLASTYKHGKNIATKLLNQYTLGVDAANSEGMTPLHVACKNGKLAMVKLLIDSGADITKTYENGRTALHVTCEQDAYYNIGLMKFLLDNHIDPDAVDGDKKKALHLAFENKHIDRQTFLINYTQLEKSQKDQLLNETIRARKFKSAQLLIDYGSVLQKGHLRKGLSFEPEFLLNNSKIFSELDREIQLEILGKIGVVELMKAAENHEYTFGQLIAGIFQLYSNTLLKGWKQKLEKENKGFLRTVLEKANQFFKDIEDADIVELKDILATVLGDSITKKILAEYNTIDSNMSVPDLHKKLNAFVNTVWNEVAKPNKYDDSEDEIVFLAVFSKLFISAPHQNTRKEAGAFIGHLFQDLDGINYLREEEMIGLYACRFRWALEEDIRINQKASEIFTSTPVPAVPNALKQWCNQFLFYS